MQTLDALEVLCAAQVAGPWKYVADYDTDSERRHPLTGDTFAEVDLQSPKFTATVYLITATEYLTGKHNLGMFDHESEARRACDEKLRELGVVLLTSEGEIDNG